jgi:hypothetical protein
MKAAFRSLLCLAIVFAVVVAVRAEEEKKEEKKAEVKTFKGTLGCGKCVFKIKGAKACCNAIQVVEGKKTKIYVLADGGKGEDYHDTICGGKAKGSVKGTIIEKGKDKGKIKPEKDGVKFDKE